jgi:hypothetical protein
MNRNCQNERVTKMRINVPITKQGPADVPKNDKYTQTHTHETYHPTRLGPPFDPNRPEWVSFVTVGPLLPLVVAMMMMMMASWVVAAAVPSWWMVVVGTFGD